MLCIVVVSLVFDAVVIVLVADNDVYLAWYHTAVHHQVDVVDIKAVQVSALCVKVE